MRRGLPVVHEDAWQCLSWLCPIGALRKLLIISKAGSVDLHAYDRCCYTAIFAPYIRSGTLFRVSGPLHPFWHAFQREWVLGF